MTVLREIPDGGIPAGTGILVEESFECEHKPADEEDDDLEDEVEDEMIEEDIDDEENIDDDEIGSIATPEQLNDND